MHQLKRKLLDTLAGGLKRRGVVSCSKWAESYRVMGPPISGPWTFKHHPWLLQPHDDETETVCVQKSTQMGFTEWALNTAFYHIDIKGENVIYILPASNPDAKQFSSSRFDPALESSPHLRNLFSDVKNVGHKRAGNANLMIKGSRSKAQMRSNPAPVIIFDEVDVMDLDNITQAFERASGQLQKYFRLLSTPTIPGKGINKWFKDSSQDHYMFRCPGCSRMTELVFPDCLEITAEDPNSTAVFDSYIKCKECGIKLDHASKPQLFKTAQWVPGYTNRIIKGYYINHLYSNTIKPHDIAIQYLKGKFNPADEQEFYNSKLGLPHIVNGAQISDAQIEACIGQYKTYEHSPSSSSVVTMGIDVGSWLNYEITQWFPVAGIDRNTNSTCRVLKADKLERFEDLDALIHQFGVAYAVIDAQPERRKSLEFAQRFYGRVKCCFYGNGINGRQINEHADELCTFSIDRTSWIDLALGRFKAGTIKLPLDISYEYREQIKSPVRIYVKDQNGSYIGRYDHASADHFAHARTYSEIAFALAGTLQQSQSIKVKM